MKIKLFIIVLLLILVIGNVQAIIIATIDTPGTLNFMPGVDEFSPEAYNAIATYNQIKDCINNGSYILEEIKINESGEISDGVIKFNEKEYSIKEFFTNLSAEDMVVSNVDYDFELKEFNINEGGFLKIKIKSEDNESEIQELVYRNITEGYFVIGNETLIEEANIVVSDDNSIYKFGDYEPVVVNAGTQIEYRYGIMKVYSNGKSFLYKNVNITPNSPFVDFSRDTIICDDCIVDGIELKGSGGWSRGSLSLSDKGYLIKNGEAIYKQNLMTVQDSAGEILIANPDADLSDYDGNWLRQTSDTLEIQTGGDGDISVEFLENHDILNTDAKDSLSAEINHGDGLRVENRISEGLIPEVVHKSSESGGTKITNDKVDLVLNASEMRLINPKPLSTEELYGKYQSVAFEIQSDSLKIDTRLRINSYSQFVVLSRDNKELIAYNKYNLPVSALIKDNELQTIQQLREKYPNIQFEIPVGLFNNSFTEENLPPYYLYLTDNFLKENPSALDNLGKIDYVSAPVAFSVHSGIIADKKSLIIGTVADPYKLESLPIREIPPPQIMIHEYEHTLNAIINEEEFVYFPNARQIDTLQGKYNQIASDAEKKLSQSSGLKGSVQSMYENAERYFVRDALERLIKDKYGKGILSFIREDLEHSKFRLKTDAEIQMAYEQNPILFNQLITSQLIVTYGPSEKMTHEEWGWSKSFELEDIKNLNDIAGEILPRWNNRNLDIYINTFPTLKGRKEMDNLVEINSGLPYAYSLYDSGGILFQHYSELSSTYREQTIEQRRANVQSGNRLVRDIYRKLTQIEFDSGKMPVEEYKAIMGAGSCLKLDCSDKLCVEYKLLCCWKNYLSSPNCS